MIQRDKYDGEIFEIFADIMSQEGLLDKEAEYLLPENFFEGTSTGDLEVDLLSIAGEHSKLYGLFKETGDKLVQDAHPGGGFKLDVPGDKELAKVETIVEQHKRNQGIAEKTPTGKLAALTIKLVALAEMLDESGLNSRAVELDGIIQRIATSLEKTAREFDEGSTADLGQERINPNLPSTEFSEQEAGDSAAQPSINFTEQESELLSAEHKREQRKQKYIEQGHLQAQKLLNMYRGQAGMPLIPETGKFDDGFAKALKDFGIQVGSYKTWGQLFNMIKQTGEFAAQLGNQRPEESYSEILAGQDPAVPNSSGQVRRTPAGPIPHPTL